MHLRGHARRRGKRPAPRYTYARHLHLAHRACGRHAPHAHARGSHFRRRRSENPSAARRYCPRCRTARGSRVPRSHSLRTAFLQPSRIRAARPRGRHGHRALAVQAGVGALLHPHLRAGGQHLFDGAMHLACLWGQRYAGYVAYPTGFAARLIAAPLMHGQRRCMVVPRSVGSRHMSCDLWLTDEANRVCDAIVGLDMAPLATGALPPAWVVHPLGPQRLS